MEVRSEALYEIILKLEQENAQLKAQHKNLCEAHCDLIEIEQETEQENERLRANWDKLNEFIGEMYLGGRIDTHSSGPIYAKMEELKEIGK